MAAAENDWQDYDWPVEVPRAVAVDQRRLPRPTQDVVDQPVSRIPLCSGSLTPGRRAAPAQECHSDPALSDAFYDISTWGRRQPFRCVAAHSCSTCGQIANGLAIWATPKFGQPSPGNSKGRNENEIVFCKIARGPRDVRVRGLRVRQEDNAASPSGRRSNRRKSAMEPTPAQAVAPSAAVDRPTLLLRMSTWSRHQEGLYSIEAPISVAGTFLAGWASGGHAALTIHKVGSWTACTKVTRCCSVPSAISTTAAPSACPIPTSQRGILNGRLPSSRPSPNTNATSLCGTGRLTPAAETTDVQPTPVQQPLPRTVRMPEADSGGRSRNDQPEAVNCTRSHFQATFGWPSVSEYTAVCGSVE